MTRSGKTELAEPIAVRPTSETGEQLQLYLTWTGLSSFYYLFNKFNPFFHWCSHVSCLCQVGSVTQRPANQTQPVVQRRGQFQPQLYTFPNKSKLRAVSSLYFLLFSALGVQTPPALPEDQRVPLAGGTHSVCNQRGSRRGGKMWSITPHSQLTIKCRSRSNLYHVSDPPALSFCHVCRFCRFWTCMLECTRSWWPSLWSRAGKQRRRSLQEETTPPLWRLTSQQAAELFRLAFNLQNLQILLIYNLCLVCLTTLKA